MLTCSCGAQFASLTQLQRHESTQGILQKALGLQTHDLVEQQNLFSAQKGRKRLLCPLNCGYSKKFQKIATLLSHLEKDCSEMKQPVAPPSYASKAAVRPIPTPTKTSMTAPVKAPVMIKGATNLPQASGKHHSPDFARFAEKAKQVASPMAPGTAPSKPTYPTALQPKTVTWAPTVSQHSHSSPVNNAPRPPSSGPRSSYPAASAIKASVVRNIAPPGPAGAQYIEQASVPDREQLATFFEGYNVPTTVRNAITRLGYPDVSSLRYSLTDDSAEEPTIKRLGLPPKELNQLRVALIKWGIEC